MQSKYKLPPGAVIFGVFKKAKDENTMGQTQTWWADHLLILAVKEWGEKHRQSSLPSIYNKYKHLGK